MDLGGIESIAWKGEYSFWGQGDEREGSHEVQEREEREDGEGETKLPIQIACFVN